MISRGYLRCAWVSSKTRKTLQVLVASLALLSISLPAFSQANQGTIQGSVFDQTGGAIAGATVTITDVARGVSRTLTSDTAGLYVAPNLTPGMYSVKGEAKGFQTLQRSNVVLETGQTVRIDLTLQPGAQEQTVTVTSEAPQIDTSDATLGGTINQAALTSLPMNGRDFKNLTQLQPGVTAYQGGGIDTWSANGTRAEDVGYLVDGLRMDEAYTGNSVVNSPMPAGDAATGLPVDAIQEINNQANPKAEAGWKPGSIVNIGIKSGTNTLHGTGFAYGRDTSFDARNFFDTPPTPKQAVELEQFGGNLGGRIIKDKLFWFADYEGLRYTVDSITSATSPATVALSTTDPSKSLIDACNALNNAFVGGTGPAVSPLSAQIAGLTFTNSANSCSIRPTNYTPGSSESMFPADQTGTSAYFNLPNIASENNGIAKLDYHLNEKQTISGTYFYGTGGITTPPNFGDPSVATTSDPFSQNYGATAQLVTGAWNWAVSSTKINEFRLGYDHFNQDYHSIDESVNPLAYGINTGATDPRTFGFPGIRITGFSSFGGSQHKVVGPDGSLQVLDHFSIVHGAHTLKLGGEYISNTVTSYQNNGGKGIFAFTSIENFLTGSLKSGGNSILVGSPARNLSNQDYALFAQDDWRITRKVVVNLGLRWEYNSVLTEAHNLLGNFDPAQGLVQAGKQIDSPLNGDFRNFSPRLGVAWDVRGDGKTVVRAGGSLMYSYLPMISYAALAQSLGLTLVPTGATIVTQGACAAGCAGSGNIGVVRASVPGKAITPSWDNQTAACVSGGTTTCGTIFPTSTLSLQCGDGLTGPGTPAPPADPSPCTTLAMDPNYRTSQIDTWTLGVQRAITNTLSLNVSYVGTHGARLEALTDINRAALGSGFTVGQIAAGDPTAADSGAENASRPFTVNGKFPYLADVNWQASIAKSNYNALEVSLNERVWHGLNFLAGYTFGHGLDDASTNSFSTVPADGLNPALMYASSDFDIRNRFTLTASYTIPGRKSPAQLLQGWQVSSVVTLQSGMPWSPKDTANDFSGTGQINNTDYYGGNWNFIGNPADFTSGPNPIPCWSGSVTVKGAPLLPGCATGAALSGNAKVLTAPAVCTAAANHFGANAVAALDSVGCYVSLDGASALIPPALGTFGNAGRNIFRDSGFRNWDLSVTKDWKFRERYDAQFKVEIFNILNHPLFSNPGGIGSGAGFNDPSTGFSGQFGCGCVTPDQASPNPVLGAGSNRAMQLGLKLTF